MLAYYLTVKQLGVKEIVVKKSRFIASVKPIANEQEVVSWLISMKKENPWAQHHCYAYVIGERDEIQKQSDDGEPSGTAGKPILEVIKQQGLKNTAVIVTRYFGGIKLGSGGLVGAYTDATVVGIEAAVKVYRVLHRNVQVEVSYAWFRKLEHAFNSKNLRLGEISFTDQVIIECYPLEQDTETFVSWVNNLTQGQCETRIKDHIYHTHDNFPH